MKVTCNDRSVPALSRMLTLMDVLQTMNLSYFCTSLLQGWHIDRTGKHNHHQLRGITVACGSHVDAILLETA